MVGHPARRAPGRQAQAPALTPEQARLLLGAEGRAAVAKAAALDLSDAARIATAEHVRRAYGTVLGPLALEQAILRRRALAKHPDGDRLFWTGPALEQASSAAVAAWRARRLPGPVLDLCCSVGGDLLAFADGSVGVDLDGARLLLAQANACELDRSVSLVRADATGLPWPVRGDVFVDPARRAGARRVFHPGDYRPSLDVVLARRDAVRSLTVKVAPGIDHARLPPDLEVEIVSLGGQVKEAVLRAGAARSGTGRCASLLPAGAGLGRDAVVPVLTGEPVAAPVVRPPGPWLLDLDGAVVRAGLVAQAVARVEGWLVDATIAYICTETPVPTPFGRWYEVLEVLPFGLKRLQQVLRRYDAGSLVVKKRGTAVEPELLRRRLTLRGSSEVTVVLTRSAGQQVALVVRPGWSCGQGPNRLAAAPVPAG